MLSRQFDESLSTFAWKHFPDWVRNEKRWTSVDDVLFLPFFTTTHAKVPKMQTLMSKSLHFPHPSIRNEWWRFWFIMDRVEHMFVIWRHCPFPECPWVILKIWVHRFDRKSNTFLFEDVKTMVGSSNEISNKDAEFSFEQSPQKPFRFEIRSRDGFLIESYSSRSLFPLLFQWQFSNGDSLHLTLEHQSPLCLWPTSQGCIYSSGDVGLFSYLYPDVKTIGEYSTKFQGVMDHSWESGLIPIRSEIPTIIQAWNQWSQNSRVSLFEWRGNFIFVFIRHVVYPLDSSRSFFHWMGYFKKPSLGSGMGKREVFDQADQAEVQDSLLSTIQLKPERVICFEHCLSDSQHRLVDQTSQWICQWTPEINSFSLLFVSTHSSNNSTMMSSTSSFSSSASPSSSFTVPFKSNHPQGYDKSHLWAESSRGSQWRWFHDWGQWKSSLFTSDGFVFFMEEPFHETKTSNKKSHDKHVKNKENPHHQHHLAYLSLLIPVLVMCSLFIVLVGVSYFHWRKHRQSKVIPPSRHRFLPLLFAAP